MTVNPIPATPAAGLADLTYNIASGLHSGQIDGQLISAYAVSGGRAGSKSKGSLHWWLANNPFATHVKLPADKSHPGGPLPMGRYRVVNHESKPNWLRLHPLDPSMMRGRNGMAIHRTGKRGSDGCIVPTDIADVKRLWQLVSKRQASGGPDVVLQVVAIGQNLDQKLNTA